MTIDDIKQELGTRSFLFNGTLKELSKLLYKNEQIMQATTGTLNSRLGVLVATNLRVLFVSRIMFGVTTEEFAYDKITSVETEYGMRYSLTLTVLGVRKKFADVTKETSVALAQHVKNILYKQNTPHNTTQADPIEQIERLAKLRDQGILTEDEFNAKKKQLLGI